MPSLPSESDNRDPYAASISNSARQKAFHAVTVAVVAIAALAWLGFSLMCLAMGFESSEYEKSANRWWHDLYSCIPVWLAFVGVTGVSALSLQYRRTGLAFLVAVLSLGMMWALFTGRLDRFLF
jgi:hypothetical protein